MVAFAIPPPSHMVCRPYRVPVRRRWCTRVVMIRAPEAPNGWPRAIALGHPLGGSGARLMTTLIHRMRSTGTRYGLQTMCEGGGMANATVLELLAV